MSKKFFWHDISSCTCSLYLCAKYQKASVKALVQVDLPMYALSKNNPYLTLVSQCLASIRKLGNRRSSEGLPSKGTNLFILIILAGDIEMNPGPRFQCGLCKKYCKASDRLLEGEECEKRFQASCSNLGDNELFKRIESGDGAWYCTNCKADCGLCSGAVLKGHKAVRCDNYDMWIHNECCFIAETQYETVNNTNCTWICPKCEFFNFSDSFFGEQVNLETENRFVPLTKEKKDRSSPCGTNKSSFISV